MTMIAAGRTANFTVLVQQDGVPIAVAGDLTAQVFTMDGRTELVASKLLDNAATGADWAAGKIAVSLSDTETGALPVGNAMLVLLGEFGIRRYRLVVETLALGTRTSLFIRDLVVDEIRKDRLLAAAAGILQDVKVSDQYLWEKVRAAESEVSHTLRVPLVPTRYFPIQPAAQELIDLGDMAWEIDPGYDYDPGMFQGDKWGYLVTRHRPIIGVDYMRFCYPSQNNGFFDVPREWLRIDSRPGHIRMIPASAGILVGSAGFALSTLINRRAVPDMVQISYTAGLRDAGADYPELLDVIKKVAVMKIVADAYLPQSGSISADGLSQSISVDMSKYSDAIEEIINGPKGSNGGLMAAIHGIRSMVF